MSKRKTYIFCCLLLCFGILIFNCTEAKKTTSNFDSISIIDSMDRKISVPKAVNHILCSGAGSLRYISYMQCQDKVLAVDDMEKDRPAFDPRPYAHANPQFKDLPLFGEFRGNDNPELIITLQPEPDLIFKTYGEMGYNPQELQEKTGIPVVVLNYGDLGKNRPAFYQTIDLIGQVMNKPGRAEEIKRFISAVISDLNDRTHDITEQKTCYVGGLSYKGPLGVQSTEPGYPPFLFLNTKNMAALKANHTPEHMNVSKEKIIEWDPDIIFIDCGTFQLDPKANAFYELTHEPAYASLQAVKMENIYSVLPYNSYTQNHGSTLANAYFIGKILYPEKFKDIDPIKKADEIYTFLLGKPVYKELNASCNEMAFKRLEL